jgi:hypothetical protein
VRTGVAEELPWPDAQFDTALACLVVGFMRDPDLGLKEMARVTRPGGTVAACMWDTVTGGMTMLQIFWDAARRVEPAAPGEAALAGTSEGDLAVRLTQAGLKDVTSGVLTSQARYLGFDDFWEPFTLAVGPAGHYLRSLSPGQQAEVREACRRQVPDGLFTLPARAWYASGVVPELPDLAGEAGPQARGRRRAGRGHLLQPLHPLGGARVGGEQAGHPAAPAERVGDEQVGRGRVGGGRSGAAGVGLDLAQGAGQRERVGGHPGAAGVRAELPAAGHGQLDQHGGDRGQSPPSSAPTASSRPLMTASSSVVLR